MGRIDSMILAFHVGPAASERWPVISIEYYLEFLSHKLWVILYKWRSPHPLAAGPTQNAETWNLSYLWDDLSRPKSVLTELFD